MVLVPAGAVCVAVNGLEVKTRYEPTWREPCLHQMGGVPVRHAAANAKRCPTSFRSSKSTPSAKQALTMSSPVQDREGCLVPRAQQSLVLSQHHSMPGSAFRHCPNHGGRAASCGSCRLRNHAVVMMRLKMTGSAWTRERIAIRRTIRTEREQHAHEHLITMRPRGVGGL